MPADYKQETGNILAYTARNLTSKTTYKFQFSTNRVAGAGKSNFQK